MQDGGIIPENRAVEECPGFRARLQELALELPVDDQILTAEQGSPLAEPISIGGFQVGNRWCIHPMEGWDANRDGSPSPHTLRRWRNFGLSGAKLIWGGEAAAVQPDGRANPNQTLATPDNRAGLAALLNELLAAHRRHVRHDRRSAGRPAADPFRPLLPAELEAAGAADRLSPSAAGRQVRHRPAATIPWSGPTATWSG